VVAYAIYALACHGADREWLPAAPLSRNKVELMEMDSTASAAMPGLGALGIGPVSIEHTLGQILEGG